MSEISTFERFEVVTVAPWSKVSGLGWVASAAFRVCWQSGGETQQVRADKNISESEIYIC